jgi:hypothetical protein
MPNETELRDRVIAVAETLIGTPYNKLDCSHYVEKVLKQFGVSLKPNSANQSKTLYNRGIAKLVDKKASVADIEKMLKKGDIIAWSNEKKYPERWKGIHHIGFYGGNGKTYESTGSGKGVHIGNLWETSDWQIVLIADIIVVLNNMPAEPAEMEDEEMLVYFFQHAARAAGYKVLQDGKVWKDAVTGENNGCDNSRGPWTQDVIKQVQKKHGLKQTGSIDGKTIYAVMSEVGNDGTAAALQAELNDLWNRVNNYAAGVKTAANMKI